MELMLAIAIGVLSAVGIYLLLARRTLPVILGLSLIGYATNLFLFASGGLVLDSAPLLSATRTGYPDPLPQALVLTAIVIGFAMTAFLVVLALRGMGDLGTDSVDGTDSDDDIQTNNAELNPDTDAGARALNHAERS
jgi:multicomponent K+:H+ antiporter subunit C